MLATGQNHMRKTDRKTGCLYLHFTLLLTVQAGYAYLYTLSPYLRSDIMVPLLYRLLVWTLPVVCLLLAREENVLDALKLRGNVGRGVTWGLLVGLMIIAGNVAVRALRSGYWVLNFDIGPNRWIGPVLLVGLSEEVVFRGFYLLQLGRRTGFFQANLLQTGLFLLIHGPGWYLLGQLHSTGILTSMGTLIYISLLLGWILRRSGSLWACMIVHSCNNFASFAVPKL
jgi:uncharacterized protein